jgi:glycosyltransferase involved in cell wall biosynthesis
VNHAVGDGLPTVVSARRGPRETMNGRVLFCYPWALHEAIGARVVLVAYARALVTHGLTVDCFAPNPVPIAREANGLYLGVFERLFSPPRTSPVMRTLLDAAGAGCLDAALPSQHGCDGPAMVAAATVASCGDYDLVGVHYTRWHSIRSLVPASLPAILFTHELDALVADEEAAVFGAPPSEYTLAMEAERLGAFDAVTTVGPDDRDRLLAVRPSLSVTSVPIPVEPAPLTPVRPESPGVLLLLSSSAIFHEMSLAWFLTHSWPRIVERHASVRLVLAGRICEAARRFGADRDPRVELKGIVDDTNELFLSADVVIAPYYFGGGIKLKVLEALARGLPIVTTSPGITNTDVVLGRDLAVADSGLEYADAVVDLLRRPDRRQAMQHSALAYIARCHQADVAGLPLQQTVDRLISNVDRANIPSELQVTDALDAAYVAYLQRSVLRAIERRDSRERAMSSPTLAHLAQQLRVLLPWVIHRTKEAGVRSLAVYGAGSHTRLMLPLWRALGGQVPRVIVVSGTPAESEVCGIPVIRLDELDPSAVDGILLSSQGYEPAMAAACAARIPALPVFHVWSPPVLGSDGLPMPLTQARIPGIEAHAPTLHR